MRSPPDPSKPSPLLPWEVIERVISHSAGDLGRLYDENSESILNFSLTCRDLRPRSLCFLVADVVLHSREHIFDFCDFLRAKPHLKTFVRSISVDPRTFVPVPLLQADVLPNLSQIEFIDLKGDPLCSLNQSSLTCSRLLSAHIRTLFLYALSFKSDIYFIQILSAFPKIAHLVCQDVFIDREDGTSARPAEVAKQRLSKRLHLRTVSSSIQYPAEIEAGLCVSSSSLSVIPNMSREINISIGCLLEHRSWIRG